MSNAKYSDIIFDYCGVLIDWRPELALRSQYPSSVVRDFFDTNDNRGFWYYDRCADLGWSEESILEEYEQIHGPAVAWVFRRYFVRKQLAIYDMIDGMPSLLRDAHAQGIRLWGLTNFTDEYVQIVHNKYPWMSLIRDTVVSSHERLCKPNPQIYTRAIRRFGVNPTTTLFVDDTVENVRAARACGMNAVQFIDAKHLQEMITTPAQKTCTAPAQ